MVGDAVLKAACFEGPSETTSLHQGFWAFIAVSAWQASKLLTRTVFVLPGRESQEFHSVCGLKISLGDVFPLRFKKACG